MKDFKKQLLRILFTLTIVAIALFLGHMLWVRYMDSPWTRDGRVRADIVNISSDISGLVTDVLVKDNQFVHKGDMLFKIDSERYGHTLAQMQALVNQRRVMVAMKRGQSKRRDALDNEVISQESREDSDLYAASASAEYNQAIAERDHAKLNVERTFVRAPVDGWVSNLLVRPGDYAQVGTAKLAIIDQNSFWVYGYFEENKLRLIHIGDSAEIKLLGSDLLLHGHVESIARGITDRDNPTDVRLLANVNPSFNWVRLAQRVPVRIKLDFIPKEIMLVAGMTCSVIVKKASK